MKWQRIVFSQLYLEPSRNGIYKSQENHGTGIKIINMGELFGYDFIADQPMKRISMTDSEIDRFCLQNGDLLFGRRSLVESGAGKCSLIDNLIEKTTFESSIIRVRLDPNLALPKFYYYWFKSLRGSGAIRAIVTGTNVKGIKGSDLKNITVDYPSIITQQKIADILSKYDDLIENNRRRIELLERSARLLYKEWFVRLRFPRHEHTPIIDGIPEGWERLKLSDLCEVKRGASPRPINNYMGGTVPWFKIGDATKSESPFIFETVELVTEDGARQSVSLEPLSLILSNSATCGIPFFTGLHGCIHDGWLCFKNFQGISKYFLYCYLLFKQRELLQSVGDGSTQKNLNTKIVEKLDIIIPNNGVILKLFDNFVNPAFTMILTLAIQNMKLRKARDILLPKLMNGEIEV